MWRGVLELLFPGACGRCGKGVGREPICPGCRVELLRLAPVFERAAPSPLESWVAAVSFEGEAGATYWFSLRLDPKTKMPIFEQLDEEAGRALIAQRKPAEVR